MVNARRFSLGILTIVCRSQRAASRFIIPLNITDDVGSQCGRRRITSIWPGGLDYAAIPIHDNDAVVVITSVSFRKNPEGPRSVTTQLLAHGLADPDCPKPRWQREEHQFVS